MGPVATRVVRTGWTLLNSDHQLAGLPAWQRLSDRGFTFLHFIARESQLLPADDRLGMEELELPPIGLRKDAPYALEP